MARTQVVAGDRVYTVSPDLEAGLLLATWTVVTARVVDEISGVPVTVPVAVDTETADLQPRAGPTGIVGLVTQPGSRSPPAFSPIAAATWRLSAPSFLPRRLTTPIARALTVAAAPGDNSVTVDVRVGMRSGQRWILGAPGGVRESITVSDVRHTAI